MGTRNLTIVINKEGETKIAQYGQWDGYPEGQGVTVLNFLSSKNLEQFQEKLKFIKFIDDTKRKQIENWLESIGSEGRWMTLDQANLYKEKYPFLSRDNGAEILNMIMDSSNEEIWIENSIDFVADSLFCEWCYVIDFNKNTFEVYKGFNKTPLEDSERFKHFESGKEEEEYYPVKLSISYDLNKLPTESEFLKYFEEREEEE